MTETIYMAIKDFGITENRDLDEKKAPVPPAMERKDAETSGVKNAHATGDGSYGRSDDSIPEKSEDGQTGETDNNY